MRRPPEAESAQTSERAYRRVHGDRATMRYVKLNQTEIHRIKELYEGVMSHACHGLFFKEGSNIGIDMAEEALRDRAKFFERAGQVLKERGWVEEIQFKDGEAVVKGS